MKKEILLSIVIPAYNEEKIIRKNLAAIISLLEKKKFSWEIVVSDDGSRDKTKSIVREIGKLNNQIKLVSLSKNKGKGGALRTGMLAAKGRYIIFMDADLSVPLENIDKFINQFRKGSRVIIASRRVEGAKIAVHQPWFRESMGRVFTFITKQIMGVNLKDFTCGFKGFTKGASRKIFSNALIDRWAYDAEILFLADKYAYEIVEIPVIWKNRSDSRVRLKSVIFETFRDLIRIRLYDIFGRYKKN